MVATLLVTLALAAGVGRATVVAQAASTTPEQLSFVGDVTGSMSSSDQAYCTGGESASLHTFEVQIVGLLAGKRYTLTLEARYYDGPGLYRLGQGASGPVDQRGPLVLLFADGPGQWESTTRSVGVLTVASGAESGSLDVALNNVADSDPTSVTEHVTGQWRCGAPLSAAYPAGRTPAQDITFSGALTGHMTTGRTATSNALLTDSCTTQPAYGTGSKELAVQIEGAPDDFPWDLSFLVGSGRYGIPVAHGPAYHGAGSYDLPGALGNVGVAPGHGNQESTPGWSTDASDGSTDSLRVTVDPGEHSGSIDATVSTFQPGGVKLHVNGRWACETDSSNATPSPAQCDPSPTAGGTGGQSSISASLTTPSCAFAAPLSLIASAASVVGVVLFATFPAQLFNRTFDENHDAIIALVKRRLGWLKRLRQAAGRLHARLGARASFAAVAVVGSLLGGLLDPAFGMNVRTVAAVTALLAALLVGAGVAAAVGVAYRKRRRLAVRAYVRALPSGLAVAAVCVLISRLTQFQPGYLYGVIGGVAFLGALPRDQEAHVIALTSVASLVVSIAAWLAWVPGEAAAAQAGAGFFLLVLQDFLAAVFVGGLVGLILGLVPLEFLPGHKLAGWHRGVWLAVFGIATFAFLQIILRPQSASVRSTSLPLWTTLGLLLAFGIVSVVFWGYFRVHRGGHADIATASRTKRTPAADDQS